MVRQYIGARYVTKVYENTNDPSSAEWQAGVTYEPLTMVTYNNSSYLSKKTVPGSIGNPASNPAYWVVTGAYNGQIMQLQQDVSDLQSDVTAIENSLKKNILCIGNSFVNFGCADILRATFDHSYTRTTGGNGFVKYTGHATDFEDQLDSAIAGSDFDNDDITDILFLSAWGDTRAYDELGAATYRASLDYKLSQIMIKIRANFPNIKRVAVSLGESRAVPFIAGDSKYNSPFAIHRIFKDACSVVGIDYIGWAGFAAFLTSQYFESDQIHPNTTGAACIGEWLKNAYYGHAEYRVIESRMQNLNFGYAASYKTTAMAEISPDKCVLRIRRIEGTNGDSVIATANSTLFDFSSYTYPLPGPVYYDIEIGIPVIGQDGTQMDFLYCTLNSDAKGILRLYNYSTPSASVTTHSKILIPNLAEIVY